MHPDFTHSLYLPPLRWSATRSSCSRTTSRCTAGTGTLSGWWGSWVWSWRTGTWRTTRSTVAATTSTLRKSLPLRSNETKARACSNLCTETWQHNSQRASEGVNQTPGRILHYLQHGFTWTTERALTTHCLKGRSPKGAFLLTDVYSSKSLWGIFPGALNGFYSTTKPAQRLLLFLLWEHKRWKSVSFSHHVRIRVIAKLTGTWSKKMLLHAQQSVHACLGSTGG